MPTIQSVTGPIETNDLGFTLMHEHIMIADWSMRQSFADWVDVEAVIERSVSELCSVKELGVSTVVDLTPINIGRDVHVMREVSEEEVGWKTKGTGVYQRLAQRYLATSSEVDADTNVHDDRARVPDIVYRPKHES